MASEQYRKVGRGGAGNYYSPQDLGDVAKHINQVHNIEAALKSQTNIRLQDVEAQAATGDTPIEDPEAKPSDYAHSGRGGAGNYKPTANSTAPGIASDLSTSIKQTPIPEGGHGGRGGAGNFRGSVSLEGGQSEVERANKLQQEAYAKTVEDVEKGMKPPEKAHLVNEKLDEP